jgi:hypothetical protein
VRPVRTLPNVNRELTILPGTVEIVFKGTSPGADGVTRDNLEFNLPNLGPAGGDLRIYLGGYFSATVSVGLASVAYDGPVTDPLWAVDNAGVHHVKESSADYTASLAVTARLAVRGVNGMILRVKYTAYVLMRCLLAPGEPIVVAVDDTF